MALSQTHLSKWLGAVVRGHLNYYAVPGNSDAIGAFRDQIRPHETLAGARPIERYLADPDTPVSQTVSAPVSTRQNRADSLTRDSAVVRNTGV